MEDSVGILGKNYKTNKQKWQSQKWQEDLKSGSFETGDFHIIFSLFTDNDGFKARLFQEIDAELY